MLLETHWRFVWQPCAHTCTPHISVVSMFVCVLAACHHGRIGYTVNDRHFVIYNRHYTRTQRKYNILNQTLSVVFCELWLTYPTNCKLSSNIGCVSACAVLPFLHVVTVLAGLGASSGRFREKKNGLDKQQQMAVSLMVHAIYSMHKNLRHNPHHGEVRQTMARIAQEVGVSWSFRNAWADVFGWRLRSAARPPRHQRHT